MDVSVIITSWNAKGLLQKCLNALRSHETKYGTEVIVVDNASSDGSPEMVKREFPDVKLIQNEKNLGFAKGNNIGIRQASGEYFCLINSDIIILPGCIDKMVDYMKENPAIGILGPKLPDPEMKLTSYSCRFFPRYWPNFCAAIGIDNVFPKSTIFSLRRRRYLLHNRTRKVEVLAGAFWMARKAATDEVGLLDEGFFFYAEDMDWCKRFWNGGWEVVFFPEALALHYHGGSSSNMPTRFYLEQRRSEMRYCRKHHSELSQIIFRAIRCLREINRIISSVTYMLMKESYRKRAAEKIDRSFWSLLLILGIYDRKYKENER